MFNVNEIFMSISGEGGYFHQGSMTLFVRFQGCNLRCAWCDTKKAQDEHGGVLYDLDELLEEIESYRVKQVLLTGGEPLANSHEDIVRLIDCLYNKSFLVQVETNGSIEIPEDCIEKAYWVIDRKCPSSGMSKYMNDSQHWESPNIIVKYVIRNTKDLKWFVRDLSKIDSLGYKGRVLLSPLNADPKLANEIIQLVKSSNGIDLNRIVLSLQIHKIVNLP
jgi:7-carboxy-7-deazaguanine synthase